MKNRAKCKLCQSIIESFHVHDHVTCDCGQISVDGGLQYYKASAYDWRNFIRVDDQGNEIIITVIEEEKEIEGTVIEKDKEEDETLKMTKSDLIKEFGTMIKNIEDLPQQALTLPITHYDYLCGLMIIKAILEEK